jgi:hypothetical protein
MKTPLWIKAILPPDFREDPGYRLASNWNGFDDPDPNCDYELALEEVRAQFDAYDSAFEALDQKAERMLRTCAAALGLEVTVIAAFKVQPDGWFYSSLALLVLAILILAVAQWPAFIPSRPNGRELIEGMHLAKDRHAWLACAFHKQLQGFPCVLHWKATCIERGVWLLVFAVALLIPAIVALSYR